MIKKNCICYGSLMTPYFLNFICDHVLSCISHLFNITISGGAWNFIESKPNFNPKFTCDVIYK